MIKKRNIEYFSIIVFILGTGSLYFQVLHMPFMALLEVLAIALMLYKHTSIKKVNGKKCVLFTLLLLSTSLINYRNGIRANDVIIWLINCFFMATLASSMTFDNFSVKFSKVMIAEALLSLVCFTWVSLLGHTLPMTTTGANSANTYYLTPYYTIGWGNYPIFNRNAGIYWEPGAHQIFLNLALYYYLSTDRNAIKSINKYYFYIGILLLAILSTQSTTGYLCLGAVVLSQLFRSNKLANRNKLKFLMFGAFLLLVFVEAQTGVIANKLEGFQYGHGSALTRYNDTYYGYYIALQRPIVGYGQFAYNTAERLSKYGIINISNGMASFAIKNGFVITFILLLNVWFGIRKKFQYGLLSNLIFFVFILMCVNTESVFLNLFMLAFMFTWRQETAKPVTVPLTSGGGY